MPTSNGIGAYHATAGNELGELFYSELGGTPHSSIPNTSTFDNEQASVYWSGTELSQQPFGARLFYASSGGQGPGHKIYQFYAWAVSPGQVTAAVPIPGTVWLFGAGLVGMLSLKRRGHAG